jgi:hypothetical protein
MKQKNNDFQRLRTFINSGLASGSINHYKQNNRELKAFFEGLFKGTQIGFLLGLVVALILAFLQT